MARITHFEIPASDTQRSMDFYKKVLNWEFTQWGQEEYWLTSTGSDDKPSINGAIVKRQEPQQPVVNTAEVDNLDAISKAVEANGGSIVLPKMAIPGVGWLIYFKDPDGVTMGAMEPDQNAK